MSAESIGVSRERVIAVADAFRATFGLPAGLAMAAGLILGLGLPELDGLLDAKVPLFVFSTQEAARGMLETIATATVAVAGISISVTVVAFTLSANQLSPRVLRSFRRDLTTQLTLAAFLGTFIYCLAVLVRLGALGPDRVPNLAVAAAVLFALVAFALFAGFVGHIANMLQPSSIIASIAADARSSFESAYPDGIGREPEDAAAARAAAESAMRSAKPIPVRSEDEGFLIAIRGGELLGAAEELDLVVRQRVPIGAYVLPGAALAEASRLGDDPGGDLGERLAPYFELGRQRTLPQDPGFAVRQLADIALKGLSPGINDPTTACNAMDAMAAALIRFARSAPAAAVRLGAERRPRLILAAPELDGLVELGFEQVCAFAGSDPVVRARLVGLLSALRDTAAEAGLAHAATARLLRSAVEGGERG